MKNEVVLTAQFDNGHAIFYKDIPVSLPVTDSYTDMSSNEIRFIVQQLESNVRGICTAFHVSSYELDTLEELGLIFYNYDFDRYETYGHEYDYIYISVGPKRIIEAFEYINID